MNVSVRHDYETPWPVVHWLEKRYEIKFDLDPCCTAATAKAPKFYTEQDDGLVKDWFGNVFLNPPWDRKNLPLFVHCAYKQSRRETTVIGLLPVRTDTEVWHDYILNYGAHELIFIKGRVKFYLDGVIQKAPNIQNVCAFPVWFDTPKPEHPKIYTVDVKEF